MSFKVSSPSSSSSPPNSPNGNNGRRASTRPEDNPYIKSLIEQRANELRVKAKEGEALQAAEEEKKSSKGKKRSKWADVSQAVSVSSVFKGALKENDIAIGLKDEDDNIKKEGQRFLGVRVDTIIRFFKVASAFPFIIVVASVSLSPKLSKIIRSDVVIRMMNMSMYVIPFILVRIVLSQLSPIVQKVTIALYLSMYLGPVTTVIFAKINLFTANTGMAEGTFCFKPARSVRMTQANIFALMGFAFEWLQHITYVLPIGIVTRNEQTLLVDYPPYLEFKYYFWIAIVASFGSGMILIINAVARGQFLYQFRRSSLIWYFIYNVGSPMYMTIVTILFYALNCDERIDPPTLIQDSKMVCYSPDHVTMANASLIAIAMYIVQNTLLPTGTYKETMRENDLDIMFVPVYLQAHYLMKCILCYIYVFFYRDNDVRVSALTALNLLLLYLNNTMKPCSVEWINVLRDTVFIHASLSGIQSMNYLRYESSDAMKVNLISTLACNVFFTSLCMYAFWSYSHRTPEYTIAKAFLDLEWQVARGGTVHPRVLEQLIALTISTDKDDWEIAKKYINQLVWLISYPNTRVQFQTTWSLANLALVDEDARQKIHDCGGTSTLLEWYSEMDVGVQLETLAVLANLTLSDVVAGEMVRVYKIIPFFINLTLSTKPLHSKFSCVALSNLTRTDDFRHTLRLQGGIPTLVGALLSGEPLKRRCGCLGLANMALSMDKEIEQVFESRTLIRRLLKMAKENQMETQKEVIALLRNLSCHAAIRPLLFDLGILYFIKPARKSPYPEVREWCEQIRMVMEKDNSLKALEARTTQKVGAAGKFMELAKYSSNEDDLELLRQFVPLSNSIEWSTWGSKLDNIFSIVFSQLPSLVGLQVSCTAGQPVKINLTGSVPSTTLEKWKDNMTFELIEKPARGKLSEFSANSDFCTYTSYPDVVGQDFFTYTVKLGALAVPPATVAIVIREERALEKILPKAAKGRGGASRSSPERHGTIRDPERMFGLNREVFEAAKRDRKDKTVNGDDYEDDIESKGGFY